MTMMKNLFICEQTFFGEQFVEDVFLHFLTSIIYPSFGRLTSRTGVVSVSPSPPHKDDR